MNTRTLTSLLIAALAAVTTACGGGGGLIADAGIGGSGITSVGAVTAVGSITVNGVKFDTQGTTVTVDDSPGAETDLKVGLVAKVQGSLNSDNVTGTASTVTVDSEIKGSVDSLPVITASGGTVSVMGQAVIVDSLTVFDNVTGLAALVPGNIVEVHGLRTTTANTIQATRIELKAAGAVTVFQVRGTIGTVATGSFTLGALTVNVNASTPLKNVPAGGLAAGQFVEVKTTSLPVSGAITANSVEVLVLGLGAPNGQQAELEGLVSGLAGSNPNFNFTISGQAISTSVSTVYTNGTAANLVNGARLEAEGSISNSVLVATKIKFKQNGTVKITAQVTAKSATTTELTVFGGTGPGITVKTTSATIFQDNSDAKLRVFGFADIQANDWLEIEAAKDAASSVTAAKVVRVKAPSGLRAILQGPVDSAAIPNNIRILGVTGVATTAQYKDMNDKLISQADFFSAAVTPNRLVKMRGQFSGTSITVEEAQLEN